MSNGMLVCPDHNDPDSIFCPQGCGICDTCLKLAGCNVQSENYRYSAERITGSSSYTFLMIGLIVGGLVGGMAIIALRQHKKRQDPVLNENLVGSDLEETENVWLAPVV